MIVLDAMRNNIDALDVINKKIQAHAAGMVFDDNLAELSQREMVGFTTAADAVLNRLSNLIELMEDGDKP